METKLKTKWIVVFMAFLLVFTPTGAVLAQDEVPPDPGAGSAQDSLIGSTTLWILPAGQEFTVTINDTYYLLNWESLDFITTSTLGDGQVEFIGAGYSSFDLLDTDGDGLVVDEFGNILTLDECDDAWVMPGVISLEAFKKFPEFAVVVGQDPSNLGVNLTWILRIFPTALNYEVWKLVPLPQDPNGVGSCKHLTSECLVNQSYNPCCEGTHCEPFNPNSENGKCVEGAAMHYACTIETQLFPEEVVSVSPSAVLTPLSREWILGPLTQAYPGSNLKHPMWNFFADELCVWEGNVCVWTHTEGEVKVADPGYYDLSVIGVTSGTEISPPRTFSLVGGQFGVYLMDNSMTNPQ